MDKKIKFEDALIVAFEVRNVMMAEYQGHEYGVSHHELMSLFMLSKKWNNNAKLSDIKNEIKANHSFEEFKKIEVMIAKKFTALENAGLIHRNKCEHDKRETLIEVTERGQSLINEFVKNAQVRWDKWDGNTEHCK